MLHACHHQKSNSTPEEIRSDFRRVLRERATNHRQFYRHLSSVSTNDRLAGKPDKSFLRISSTTKPNYKDSHAGYKNKPNMVESIAEEESITCSSSSKPPSHASHNDQTTVNHQPTILNVGKIQFNNDGQSASLIYNDDTPMTSVASTVEAADEELLRGNREIAALPISVDRFSFSNPTPKYFADCANPLCPPSRCVSSASSSSSSSTSPPGGTRFVNATIPDSHDDDIIAGSVSAVDDADVARNLSTDDKLNDNKSRVPRLSAAESTQFPLSSAPTSASVIATAINNNNKTCKLRDRNHSNYLTLVRATSSNGCSAAKFDDKCRKNCDKIWCPTSDSQVQGECETGEEDKKGKEVKENFSLEDTRAESVSLESRLCLQKIIEKFESVGCSPKGAGNGKNISKEDLESFSSQTPSPADDDSSNVLDSLSLLIDSAVQEGHLELHQSLLEVQQGIPYQQYYNFPCVDKLVRMYTKLLQDKKTEMKPSESVAAEKQPQGSGSGASCDTKLIAGLQIKDDRTADMNRSSPVSDEGCQMASSPFSSDLEDNEQDSRGAADKSKAKEKVLRSSSSDSALDLDEEPPMEPPPNMNTGRRLTLTVTDIPLRAALLPVADPNILPDSTVPTDPTPSPPAPQTNVPSKVILEERIVEIPEDKFVSNSRRESAQSTLSDFNPIECGAVRIVRTPSVVVSDYSDDILCGVTLEEIEYFRAHRMRRRSSADSNLRDDAASDVSAASSCSNLDYCGSTISGLDGTEYYMNGERMFINRKVSDCSTCSTVSGDDEDVENSNSNSSAVGGELGSGLVLQDNEDITDEQLQQKENELQRLAKERKKIQVKARHPKFIN